jgi:hypothetical protein
MPANVLLGHRKYSFYQANVTDEANTDASGTWGAPESTLVNSMKAKINLLLTALRAANIINGSVVKTGTIWGAKSSKLLQANITASAATDSTGTYDAAAQTLINELKAKLNLILASLNAAGFGGANRHVYYGYLPIRQQATFSLQISAITLTDADGTYTAGGAGEQGLINEIKTKLNTILAACRAAKVLS